MVISTLEFILGFTLGISIIICALVMCKAYIDIFK